MAVIGVALRALALAGVLTAPLSSDASAQSRKSGDTATHGASADNAAIKTCHANISKSTPGRTVTKVGTVRPLHGTVAKRASGGQAPTPGMKIVDQKNLRMYWAPMEGLALLGTPFSQDVVCFYEDVGGKYRFIQACTLRQHSRFDASCDLTWIR